MARAQRPRETTLFGRWLWDQLQRRSRETEEPYSYAQLARDIHARSDRTGTERYLRAVANGLRNPSADTVALIATGLGVDINETLIIAGYAPQDLATALAAISRAGVANRQSAASEALLRDLAAAEEALRQAKRTIGRLFGASPGDTPESAPRPAVCQC